MAKNDGERPKLWLTTAQAHTKTWLRHQRCDPQTRQQIGPNGQGSLRRFGDDRRADPDIDQTRFSSGSPPYRSTPSTGYHIKLHNEADRTVIVTLHRELARGTLGVILRQADLSVEDLPRLL